MISLNVSFLWGGWGVWNSGTVQDSRVPWTARRSNQSISKEINPEYSLEGLMLKLKLQYFGHLTLNTNLLEQTLILVRLGGRRRRGRRRMMVGWHN